MARLAFVGALLLITALMARAQDASSSDFDPRLLTEAPGNLSPGRPTEKPQIFAPGVGPHGLIPDKKNPKPNSGAEQPNVNPLQAAPFVLFTAGESKAVTLRVGDVVAAVDPSANRQEDSAPKYGIEVVSLNEIGGCQLFALNVERPDESAQIQGENVPLNAPFTVVVVPPTDFPEGSRCSFTYRARSAAGEYGTAAQVTLISKLLALIEVPANAAAGTNGAAAGTDANAGSTPVEVAVPVSFGEIQFATSASELRANQVDLENQLSQAAGSTVEIVSITDIQPGTRRQGAQSRVKYSTNGDASTVSEKLNAAAADPQSPLSTKYNAVPGSATASKGDSTSAAQDSGLSTVAIGAIAAAGTVLVTGMIIGAVVIVRRTGGSDKKKAAPAVPRPTSAASTTSSSSKYGAPVTSTESTPRGHEVAIEDVTLDKREVEEDVYEV